MISRPGSPVPWTPTGKPFSPAPARQYPLILAVLFPLYLRLSSKKRGALFLRLPFVLDSRASFL